MILVCDTPTGAFQYSYQIYSKYFQEAKGVRVSIFDTLTYTKYHHAKSKSIQGKLRTKVLDINWGWTDGRTNQLPENNPTLLFHLSKVGSIKNLTCFEFVKRSYFQRAAFVKVKIPLVTI